MKNAFFYSIAACLLSAACVPASMAQTYPTKPVRMVVAYAAGGSGDLLARLLGQQLEKRWGQQLVVENRPGGGGFIGTDVASRSAPDGYTIYLGTSAGPLTAGMFLGRADYTWRENFSPVSLIAVGYQVMLVSAQAPSRSLSEFLTFAKSNPEKYNVASIGLGSAPHLAAELFQSQAGVKLVHVPYNGSSAQAITDLMGGDISTFIVGTSTVVPLIQTGKLRGLAVTSPQRLQSLPDVPTFVESGMPAFDYNLWFAVMVPAKTPAEIIQKLHEDIIRAVAEPTYQKALSDRGFEAKSAEPGTVASYLDKDFQLNKAIAEKLNLK